MQSSTKFALIALIFALSCATSYASTTYTVQKWFGTVGCAGTPSVQRFQQNACEQETEGVNIWRISACGANESTIVYNCSTSACQVANCTVLSTTAATCPSTPTNNFWIQSFCADSSAIIDANTTGTYSVSNYDDSACLNLASRYVAAAGTCLPSFLLDGAVEQSVVGTCTTSNVTVMTYNSSSVCTVANPERNDFPFVCTEVETGVYAKSYCYVAPTTTTAAAAATTTAATATSTTAHAASTSTSTSTSTTAHASTSTTGQLTTGSTTGNHTGSTTSTTSSASTIIASIFVVVAACAAAL